MVNRVLIILISSFLFVSCSHYSKNVERALRLAGDNRVELEKVLEYYSKRPEDSLKFRAAEFLIANMPGKYSEDDHDMADYISLFKDWRKIFKQGVTDKPKAFDSLVNVRKLGSAFKIKDDVRHITSDFLINNIERSFEVVSEQPWGKDMSFDVFCEYILPYRVGTEPLERWRDRVLEDYADIYDSLRNSRNSDILTACIKVFDRVGKTWDFDGPLSTLPHMSYSMVAEYRGGTCYEKVVWGTFIMRALGIPVSIDYTPQWPFRNKGHEWNSVRTNNGRHYHVIIADSKPCNVLETFEYTVAKVCRKTFRIQPGSLALVAGQKEGIPPSFYDPCFIDISEEVFGGYDVSLPLRPPGSETSYAYLAVFDNQKWVPIHWGKRSDPTVFTHMGKDVVYLPVYYYGGDIKAANSPFHLTPEGDINWLHADTTQLQSLILWRKYRMLMRFTQQMKGGRFQAANRADFSDAVTLYTIPDHPALYFQEVRLNNSHPYRYYRYFGPDGAACNIAELEFYGDDKGTDRLTGHIIGTPGSWNDDPSRTMDKAFDDDGLSFYDAREDDGAWVGMDFDQPKIVRKIRYLPRNDDNHISPGQTYELFYWGNDGWVSLGQQVAKDYMLYYHNAPTNALFLLRNLTKGKEERIFTYEDGKQVWW